MTNENVDVLIVTGHNDMIFYRSPAESYTYYNLTIVPMRSILNVTHHGDYFCSVLGNGDRISVTKL